LCSWIGVQAPLHDALMVAPQVWLSILNATLCTAVSVLSVMMAIERIGPAMSSQIGMIGPMVTILLGAFSSDSISETGEAISGRLRTDGGNPSPGRRRDGLQWFLKSALR
jgi:hypothetical protein